MSLMSPSWTKTEKLAALVLIELATLAGGLLGLAGASAGVLLLMAAIALVGGWWVARAQPRGPDGRFIGLLIGAAAVLAIAGCQSRWISTPNAPGHARQSSIVERLTIPPDFYSAVARPSRAAAGRASQAGSISPSLPSPPGGGPSELLVPEHCGPITYERIETHSEVRQPDNPSAAALVGIDGLGGAKASVPPSHKPEGPPPPPSPTERALGGMVWLGVGLLVIGVLGVALRMASGLHPALAVARLVPVGVSVTVALLGGGLILLGSWLADAPLWQRGAVIVAAILIGLVVAFGDNLRAWTESRRRDRAAMEPPHNTGPMPHTAAQG